MSVALVATGVGIRAWTYFVELSRSTMQFNPDFEVIGIDGGNFPVWNTTFTHAKVLHYPGNCQECQNVGIKYAMLLGAEWIFVSDVDVASTGKVDMRGLDKRYIYGPKMHRNHAGVLGHWLDGWLYLFHRSFFEQVGFFDERFQGSGFEDADICFRGEELGFFIQERFFPFNHLEDGVKIDAAIAAEKSYNDIRTANIDYLLRKFPERDMRMKK